MGIELRIEASTTPWNVPLEKGGSVNFYDLRAYRGDQCVCSLAIARQQDVTDPQLRSVPLFYDRVGNPQTYCTSIELPGIEVDNFSTLTEDHLQVGVALVKEGQRFCKDSFGTNLLVQDGFEGHV